MYSNLWQLYTFFPHSTCKYFVFDCWFCYFYKWLEEADFLHMLCVHVDCVVKIIFAILYMMKF